MKELTRNPSNSGKERRRSVFHFIPKNDSFTPCLYFLHFVLLLKIDPINKILRNILWKIKTISNFRPLFPVWLKNSTSTIEVLSYNQNLRINSGVTSLQFWLVSFSSSISGRWIKLDFVREFSVEIENFELIKSSSTGHFFTMKNLKSIKYDESSHFVTLVFSNYPKFMWIIEFLWFLTRVIFFRLI